MNDQEDELGVFSCLEMIPYIIDSGASEILMNISLLCKGTSLSCYADSIIDVKQLLKTKLYNTGRLMENSFYTTPATKQITTMMWPEGE